jgi:PEP-CTERM motif
MFLTVLSKFCMASVSLFALTMANCVYAGFIYTEAKDAGITLETSQLLPTGTTTILGTLHDEDGADIYDFAWEGGMFSASTLGSDFDTMLSIFDQSGNLLAFNDDFFTGNGDSFVSSDLQSGNYLLGITYYDNNYAGDLSGYSNVGFEADYQIELSPASPQLIPEPGSIALLTLGLVSLIFNRRKKFTLPRSASCNLPLNTKNEQPQC